MAMPQLAINAVLNIYSNAQCYLLKIVLMPATEDSTKCYLLKIAFNSTKDSTKYYLLEIALNAIY